MRVRIPPSPLAKGLPQIPCVFTDADPETVKADRIADNKVFEFTKWLDEELAHEVDMLDVGLDLSDFGLQTMQMDFDDDMDMDEEEVDEEEKRRRFAEYLAQQEQEQEVQITTQQEIEHAKQKLKEEPTNHKKNYISVTCEKCGCVFFVREGDAQAWE